MRLPDGSRAEPDAPWLSPEQVAELLSVSAGYRPDAVPESLDNPEAVSGELVLPGFVFEVRRPLFEQHEPAGQEATQ